MRLLIRFRDGYPQDASSRSNTRCSPSTRLRKGRRGRQRPPLGEALDGGELAVCHLAIVAANTALADEYGAAALSTRPAFRMARRTRTVLERCRGRSGVGFAW